MPASRSNRRPDDRRRNTRTTPPRPQLSLPTPGSRRAVVVGAGSFGTAVAVLLARADYVFLGVPSRGLAEVIAGLNAAGLPRRTPVISLAKGLVPP
jgi:glycerol-3-phosphate dehydrogenase (NAD(P)+)